MFGGEDLLEGTTVQPLISRVVSTRSRGDFNHGWHGLGGGRGSRSWRSKSKSGVAQFHGSTALPSTNYPLPTEFAKGM